MSDAPELFPEWEHLPPSYAFCGPLLMEQDIPLPASVQAYQKQETRPLVFLTMGSSGDPELFKAIVTAFAGQPYDVFVASTTIFEKTDVPAFPENVTVEPFYPALAVTKMADVAVIHGGQGTVYTTLFAGTPFVGIPMFSEQQYNLENVARGAGSCYEGIP